MKRHLLLFLLFHVTCFAAFAQKEANVWYFGTQAGLDFNSGSPVVLTDGQMITPEGCASLCDVNGNLLFYTEGSIIWNRNHIKMPNGQNLTGLQALAPFESPTNSTSQASIIVPAPKRPNIYYVFSLSSSTGGSSKSGCLYYSVVDMNLAGGLGDVVAGQKGVLLDTNFEEYLGAVRHANGRDVWVIAQNKDGKFIAYPLDDSHVGSGVSSSPGGLVRAPGHNPAGCMTVSPNGKKLATAMMGYGFKLFDFDNATGIVSNPVLLNPEIASARYGYSCYGASFSPDSKLLYGLAMDSGFIFQWNVLAGSSTAIAASATRIGAAYGTRGNGMGGAMQIGPDRKIYVAQRDTRKLGVINDPDIPGMGCNFQANAIDLKGKISGLGLPGLVQSFFDLSIIQYSDTCLGMRTKFSIAAAMYADSIRWYFGDAFSGVLNTDTGMAPVHVYTQAGPFLVTAIMYKRGVADTIYTTLTINPNPVVVDLGSDTDVCTNSFTLQSRISYGSSSYLWSTGAKTPSVTVTQDGTYWLEVAQNGCSAADTINVSLIENVSLDNDTVICSTDLPLVLKPKHILPGAQYSWSTGSTADQIEVVKGGTYWISAILKKCQSSDTINVGVVEQVTVHAGNDTVICVGNLVTIGTYIPEVLYQWSNGATTPYIAVSNPEDYVLTVTLGPCVAKDTVTITVLPYPLVDLGADTSLCPGDAAITLTNQMVNSDSHTNRWSNGTAATGITINTPGIYWLTVTNALGCATTDTVTIGKGCYIAIPNAFTPNGDGINDYFFPRDILARSVKSFHMQIYNRWGNMIFETNATNGRGWDGTHNGTPESEGVYVYVIEVSYTNDVEENYKGNITLLR